MTPEDLRTKTPDELASQYSQLKKEMFNLRFQQATGQLTNTSRMRAARREAARVLTIINERRRADAAKKGS